MKQKMKSIEVGIERDLSQVQIDYINEQMATYGNLPEGKHCPCVQEVRYGKLVFDMPKCGYFAFIGDNVWKCLKGIARKSNTTLYINNNCCIETGIMFVAQ